MSLKPEIRSNVESYEDTRRALATVAKYLSGLVVNTTATSNPPSDAELDLIFGSPADVGSNFAAIVDDTANDRGWLVASTGSVWWYVALTKAV